MAELSLKQLEAKIDNLILSSANYDAGHLFSENGYQKLSNGLIFQWGRATTAVDQNITISFPMAFPNACLSVAMTEDTNNVGTWNLYRIRSFTNTQLTIQNAGSINSCYYIAIGY